MENYFVYIFFEKYRSEFKKILVPIDRTIGISRDELLKEAKNYISWIVFHLLNKTVVDFSHLNFFDELFPR